MKILWVEDNTNVIINKIINEKIFNVFFTEEECNELLKSGKDIGMSDLEDELNDFKNVINISTNISKFHKLIRKNTYNLIILDIDMRIDENGKEILKEELKKDFTGSDNQFNEFIRKISETSEFTGMLLLHIIAKKYKWDDDIIKNRIVFLTANSKNQKDFKDYLIEINSLASGGYFIYETGAKIIQLNKTTTDNNKKLINWLENSLDYYSAVLKKHSNINMDGVTPYKYFLNISKNIKTQEPISFRKLFETICKIIYLKIEEEVKTYSETMKSKKNNPQTKKLEKQFIEESSYLPNWINTQIANGINNNFDAGKFKQLLGYKNKKCKIEYNSKLEIDQRIYLLIDHFWIASTKDKHSQDITSIERENRNYLYYYELKEIISWFDKVMKEINHTDLL